MCKRTRAIKNRWYKLGQRRCHCGVQLNWCGNYKNSATVEHILPKSAGGTLAKANTLIVCRKCNADRGSEPYEAFVSRLSIPKKEWLCEKAAIAERYYNDRDSRRRS